MNKLTPMQAQLRMAKHSPLYKHAVLYGVSEDNGTTVYDAEGQMQYDRISQTYGYVDRTKETNLTVAASYEGSHRITIVSDVAPNGLAIVLLDGVFNSVLSVHAGDVLGVSTTLDCVSLPADEPPNIRIA